MEKNSFINFVWEQFQRMSSAQKDEWILAKAKPLPDAKQEDFMMTLTGQKFIEDMSEWLLSVNAREIGCDWITSLLRRRIVHDNISFAPILLEVFRSELCRETCPSRFIEYSFLTIWIKLKEDETELLKELKNIQM